MACTRPPRNDAKKFIQLCSELLVSVVYQLRVSLLGHLQIKDFHDFFCETEKRCLSVSSLLKEIFKGLKLASSLSLNCNTNTKG